MELVSWLHKLLDETLVLKLGRGLPQPKNMQTFQLHWNVDAKKILCPNTPWFQMCLH